MTSTSIALQTSNNLNVTGNTTTGSLSVNGTSTLTGNVTCEGNVVINGNLGVGAAATFVSIYANGSANYYMPYQSSNYKKFILYLFNYENDTTTNLVIDYPTAFKSVSSITANTTGLTASTTIDALTVTSPNSSTNYYTGVIIVEGY